MYYKIIETIKNYTARIENPEIGSHIHSFLTCTAYSNKDVPGMQREKDEFLIKKNAEKIG